jgi:D-alanyl-D-alanine carboxypeptidase
MKQIIKSITAIALIMLMALAFVGCNSTDDRNTQDERVISDGQGISESTEDHEWALWLINAHNPIPEGYEFELAPIGYSRSGEQRFFDSRVAGYAIAMIEAALADGITLTPESTYRAVPDQIMVFLNHYRGGINSGLSHEEAFARTASSIMVPGTSEHNAGLAIDFNLIAESFDQTEEFAWLQENAHRFGFILRYERDTQHITGIIYEPWHWRFVGVYHAGRIRESGLTLEEYIEICKGDSSVVEAFMRDILTWR